MSAGNKKALCECRAPIHLTVATVFLLIGVPIRVGFVHAMIEKEHLANELSGIPVPGYSCGFEAQSRYSRFDVEPSAWRGKHLDVR